MTELTKENIKEFVTRFGQLGDMTLDELGFDLKEEKLRIGLQIWDHKATKERWFLLIHLEGVKMFKYDIQPAYENYSDAEPIVLINSFCAGYFVNDHYGELIYVDLLPEEFEEEIDIDKLDELTKQDYLKSCILFAAETVSWELQPIEN